MASYSVSKITDVLCQVYSWIDQILNFAQLFCVELNSLKNDPQSLSQSKNFG